MIYFECGGCGNALRVNENQAGKTGNCPKCNKSLVVPMESEVGIGDGDPIPWEALGERTSGSKAAEEMAAPPLSERLLAQFVGDTADRQRPKEDQNTEAPEYGGMRTVSILLKVTGAAAGLLGIVTALVGMVRDMGGYVAMGVACLIVGVLHYGLGEAAVCLRDIAINSFSMRKRT
jgi:hypothetical protein